MAPRDHQLGTQWTSLESDSSARKRLSTNALASQLYRSGSFNGSGMGSNYDTTDDVYSDVSLEDVLDLSHKSYSGAHRSDPDRSPQHSAVQAPHPVAFPYHPPPSYPRFPPYDPYAAYHYPNPFYSPSYYAQHDVVKEEPAVWSWPSIILLILLVIGSLGIVYRSFSRETRRKIAAWLPLPRFSQQTARTGTRHDAAQNYPAEFLQRTERNGDDSTSREDRGEGTVMKNFIDLVYENDDCRVENEDEELSRLHNYDDSDENEDARFRNIKCPSMKKLAVGTGTYVSTYNRYNSIEINRYTEQKTK